jgi:RNA polymerase sigma-70 factor (ECF subfamily)
VAASRETIRLAFVAALQYLPARQRAVLILREVLRWQATEVAELLETSVASVNSALQRARATLAARDIDPVDVRSVDPDQQALLARYVDAFERYDVTMLVDLLHEDAIQSMPPFDMWLRGPDEISRWYLGPGIGCKGSRLLPTTANGCPAFGQYRVDPNGGHAPWALQVIEVSGERIVGLHAFLDTSIFTLFGLPAHLDG